MKKTFLTTAVLSVLSAFSEPTGNYLTWFGYFAGNDGTGDYSNMIGAYAGQDADTMSKVGYYGVMAGFGSTNLTDCIAVGYRAMQGALNGEGTIAIGNGAGRNSVDSDNCFWIGKNTGRDAWERNKIRIFSNCVKVNGSTYVENPMDTATNVFFFGNSLYDIIASFSLGGVSVPTKFSDLIDDRGYVTYDDLQDAIDGAGTDVSALSETFVFQNTDSRDYKSLLRIGGNAAYTFTPENNPDHLVGISFERDDNRTLVNYGFNQTSDDSVMETVHPGSAVQFVSGSTLAAHSGSSIWVENPDDILLSGDNGASDAITLGEYIREVVGSGGSTNDSGNKAVSFCVTSNKLEIVKDGSTIWSSTSSQGSASNTAQSPKRIAMFIIPKHEVYDTHPYSSIYGFELKASVDATDFRDGLVYVGNSNLADIGGEIDGFTISTMTIYSQRGCYGDNRNLERRYNTLSEDDDEYYWVVFVKPSDVSGDPGWLSSENDDLHWVYCRLHSGTGESLESLNEVWNRAWASGLSWQTMNANGHYWRPIQPVKWLSEMPSWAR